jgi:hypothetical protein
VATASIGRWQFALHALTIVAATFTRYNLEYGRWVPLSEAIFGLLTTTIGLALLWVTTWACIRTLRNRFVSSDEPKPSGVALFSYWEIAVIVACGWILFLAHDPISGSN